MANPKGRGWSAKGFAALGNAEEDNEVGGMCVFMRLYGSNSVQRHLPPGEGGREEIAMMVVVNCC